VVDPHQPGTSPLMALTLQQPNAWAVCHAGRDIENRRWRPPPFIANRRLAIHAGKAWGKSEKLAASTLACRLHPQLTVPLSPEGYVFGAVVAVARISGFIDLDLDGDRGPFSFRARTTKGFAAIGGQLTEAQVEAALASPWWRGPCGWLLGDVQVLAQHVPLGGRQKLWSLPSDAALRVAAQVSII